LRPSIEELLSEDARLRDENAALRRENAALRARMGRLEARLAILERVKGGGRGDPPPPFPSPTPTAASKKRPGPPEGHRGMSWSIPPGRPVEVVLPLQGCPHCGGPVTVYAPTQDHVVVDLPEVQPVVTKYRHERGYCPRCQRTVRAKPARDEPVRGHVGMRALALIAEWKTRLAIPYGKIARMLRGFHLPVSRGGLPACTRRVSEWLKPRHEELSLMLRRTDRPMHADETSWPVNGKNGWVWMFHAGEVTVYFAEPTRSGAVVVAVLGKDWSGVLITDFYGAYSLLVACVHQFCWAHLLREAKEIAALGEPVAKRFHAQLTVTYREADIVAQASEALTPTVRRKEYRRIDKMLSNLRKGHSKNPDVERLKNRIARHQESLLTFLLRPDVEPTNNRGERKIRPAVIARKVSGGSRVWPGARAHAAIMSCIESLGNWNITFLDLVRSSACTPELRRPLESVVPN
jgi:transposase